MPTTRLCWICGDAADSGEHIIKRSDLKSLVGAPTQRDPIYLHTAKRRNVPIGSLDAKALKSPARICQYCNNTRTQPHDRAWQFLSETLRFRQPPISANQCIRANNIFPYDTRRAMRHVHLYFLKLFGIKIVEGSIPIDLKHFANAILNDRLHPNVYLAFGPSANDDDRRVIAGGSDVEIESLQGRAAFAAWIHHVGPLCVEVIFAADGEKRQGLEGAWHPRFGRKLLMMRRF